MVPKERLAVRRLRPWKEGLSSAGRARARKGIGWFAENSEEILKAGLGRAKKSAGHESLTQTKKCRTRPSRS